jgi:hypothetical protein
LSFRACLLDLWCFEASRRGALLLDDREFELFAISSSAPAFATSRLTRGPGFKTIFNKKDLKLNYFLVKKGQWKFGKELAEFSCDGMYPKECHRKNNRHHFQEN